MSTPSVFMIGWEYPPHNSGGLGVACEGLTKALADRQTQIYFTLPYHHGQPIYHMNVIDCVDPTWESEGLTPPFPAYTALPKLKTNTLVDADELHTLPLSELERRVTQYQDIVASEAVEKYSNVDLIHAHDWMTFPAAQKTSQELGKPMIAHVHSTEFDRVPTGGGSPFIHQTEYEGLHAADQVIVVSLYTKQLLIDKYQVNPNKITVIHNGTPDLLSSPQSGYHQFAAKRPVIVFMGRLTMQKGPDYFIQLAQRVLHDIPKALFIVAGDGDMYRQLLFTTASQGLSAKVLFSGFLRGSEREQLLDRADVFVMPSLSEPFGLVAVEAAQRQTPVIVSKTAGVHEVMSSAVAIDFWDTEKMAEMIKKLIHNRPARQIMVRKQLKDVATTTWQTAANQVHSVYQKTSQT